MQDEKLSWWKYNGNPSKVITFVVTKDCQLACKYCYLVSKNTKGRMSFEIAQKAVDYILCNRQFFNEDFVTFDFIGGEPFLEIDLIDRICDYIKIELYRRTHPWFDNYMFAFSTNGINYDNEKVQNFIQKNKKHLSICITIDGTKRKHDINRVYKESGKGSYDDVARNIPIWLSQFPEANTKVTLSSEDLPYIRESVLHLFSMGIHTVYMNCVFEDVWKEGDDIIFENQLVELADSIIENKLYLDYNCSIFDESIGKPLKDDHNWCGAGKMLAIDALGNFYPCNRFVDFSLRNKGPRIIGNVFSGINPNLVRPFITLDLSTQSKDKCVKCDVAKGCAWCQGENYDAAASNTIYQRATAICKMHKARVRANNYYWSKLFRKLDMEGQREEFERKQPKYNRDLC